MHAVYFRSVSCRLMMDNLVFLFTEHTLGPATLIYPCVCRCMSVTLSYVLSHHDTHQNNYDVYLYTACMGPKMYTAPWALVKMIHCDPTSFT